MIVPYRSPLRQAQSSMPTTRGACGGSKEAARIIRNSVSPLTGMASLSDKREPGSPPTAKPIASWLSQSRTVRRAFGRTVSGSLSVKIRRGHCESAHRNRRACSRISTIRPCHGRSANRSM